MIKTCFVSSLYLGEQFREPDVPSTFQRIPNIDYLLFTNVPKHSCLANTSWDVIEYIDENPKIASNCIVHSRVAKFQPWRIPILIERDYDIIIYCDAYWTPIPTLKWEQIINQLLQSKSGIIQSLNPYRDCAYDECVELIKANKESVGKMEKTIQLFEQNSLPRHYALYRNTFLCYQPKNYNVKKLFGVFWELYYDNKYTYRDQPLYSLSSFLSGIKPDIVTVKDGNGVNVHRMDHILFEMSGKRSDHTYTNTDKNIKKKEIYQFEF
jgi:hypothetical protein